MTETKKIIIDEIKKIYDPEIPVNIYELGLIYNLEVDEKNNVKVDMTLTSPNCPVAESLPNQVKENIKKIKGVNNVDLQLVWEPPWTKDRMSESAKLELNL
ncbi:MAG: SUF system Fe-S cluster assembly protein [Candidatus Pelagibacter sp. TMED64]|nr:SUF system Fe-S cluster assembly protein [Candidatus Pelagibacter sp.]OUU67580.1 MAG: SUF system Fe-S cluster assembly protein [Candidatus Pelagibacter sp. TMED64]|tara:strand:- start:2029 stop:2331 length:303 start_codon:yes stop_codon:yes gene_type:complete